MFASTTKDDSLTAVKTAHQDTKNSLNQAANEVGHEMRTLYNAASEELTQAGAYISREVRNNPRRSTAIALGVGMFLGMILRR